MLIPHKGDEANATVFITYENIFKDMMISGVKLPECRVIDEVATAFALLTDGCEKHSFFCSKFDQEINQWSDPNMPAEKFFNPLIENLKNLKATNETLTEANTKWIKFLNEGTPNLKSEPDDKTMILGILI